ncbi:Ankyrin repeat domain-containing protein 50 [Sesbania bispinosa]|nr:Ankyrin repeat domain-containing protein 50 [Sesbania bispinosa]
MAGTRRGGQEYDNLELEVNEYFISKQWFVVRSIKTKRWSLELKENSREATLEASMTGPTIHVRKAVTSWFHLPTHQMIRGNVGVLIDESA